MTSPYATWLKTEKDFQRTRFTSKSENFVVFVIFLRHPDSPILSKCRTFIERPCFFLFKVRGRLLTPLVLRKKYQQQQQKEPVLRLLVVTSGTISNASL